MGITLVGGKFGSDTDPDSHGKRSGYIEKLKEQLIRHGITELSEDHGILCYNGGSYDTLIGTADTECNILLWFPDVPNDKPKLVEGIKKKFPQTLLITSKNNLDRQYTFYELLARALKVKANLFVEFTHDYAFRTSNISAAVCDPLGNQFCTTTDISVVAETLVKRIKALQSFTRLPSQSPHGSWLVDYKDTPPASEEFLNIIREYADVYHELIHGVNKDRLLGNASFRCENGFPSFRTNDPSSAIGENIYVSRRNIDKRMLTPEGFVPVRLIKPLPRLNLGDNVVEYLGFNKPSVDTPVQLLLYNHFKHIRFIIHSHTYIKDAPMTKSVIPCGALEEFPEIAELQPWDTTYAFVNLRGHGSLAMASQVSTLLHIPYIARQVPEDQEI